MKLDPLQIVKNRKRLEAAARCQLAGNYDEAAQIYSHFLECEPGHPGALHGLGVLYLRTGRLVEGEEAIRLAIVGNPDAATYWCDLGEACRTQERYEEAIAAYRRALALEPGFAEAHNNLGVTLVTLGEDALAIRELQAAIAARSEYAEAHNNLGVLRERLGQFDAALQSYETAVRLRPDFADALANYAQLLRTRPDLMEGSLRRLAAEADDAIAVKAKYPDR
jgi:protein O-GlcNAc transferase